MCLKYDCSIWPIVQLINFYFIPTVYRLLYVNFVSLLWNALLSYLMFNVRLKVFDYLEEEL